MRSYIIGFVIGVVACLCVFWSCGQWRCYSSLAGGETEIEVDSVYIVRAAEPVHIVGHANTFVFGSAKKGDSSRGLSIACPPSYPIWKGLNHNVSAVNDKPILISKESIRGLAPAELEKKSNHSAPALSERLNLFSKENSHSRSIVRLPVHSIKGGYNSPAPTLSDEIAFKAQLDTIFRSDTISLRYDYPENLFTFSLRPRPDSVLFKQIIVRPKPEPWWVKPALIIGGVAVGAVIGRSVSN